LFFAVNTKSIDKVLTRARDIDKLCVRDVCKPCDISKLDDNGDFKPHIILFEHWKTVLSCLPKLSQLEKSVVFNKFWTDRCREVKECCASIEDVAHKIWNVVEKRYKKGFSTCSFCFCLSSLYLKI